MKIILIFTLTFFSIINIFACKCVNRNFAQVYLESDVVAIVTIGNTYGNKEHEKDGLPIRSYSADLKFEKIYKGKEFNMLNVFGTSTYADSGACEKLVKKGEKYLIMLRKNLDGEYLVSSCSTMPSANARNLEKFEKIFTIIEKNKSKIAFKKFADYQDESEEYDKQTLKLSTDFTKLNTNFKNKIGIYSVTINDKGEIEKVIPVEKIGIKEKKIQELIKKNFTIYDGFKRSKGEYLILLEL